jgi:capsular exopolysaccharide synthesis family protein
VTEREAHDEPVHSVPPVTAAKPPQVASSMATFSDAYNERLVISSASPPAPVEQYRRLAATLHQAQLDHGIKTVMVASALAGEGKTLTATNLALTLSESYRRRVLLIDADLRRPMIHEVFKIPNVSGLSEGINAARDQKLTLVELSPHLSVLTAGRPEADPMSSLTSERMRRLLQEASERYEWVVLDTPPVGLLSDATLLADMVDVSILVIAAGRAPFEAVNKAVAALGRDKIIGVVLNRVEERPSTNGDYYHSYYSNTAARG